MWPPRAGGAGSPAVLATTSPSPSSPPAWAAGASGGLRLTPYPRLRLPWHEAAAWCTDRHAGHLASFAAAADIAAAARRLAPALAFGLSRAAGGSTFSWAGSAAVSGGATAPPAGDARLPDPAAAAAAATCGMWNTYDNTWALAECGGGAADTSLVPDGGGAVSAAATLAGGGALCWAGDDTDSPSASPPLLPYSLPFRGLELLVFPYGGGSPTAAAGQGWAPTYSTAVATCAAYGAEVMRLPANFPGTAAVVPAVVAATSDDALAAAAGTPHWAHSTAVSSGVGAGAGLAAASDEAAALLAALTSALQRLPGGWQLSSSGLLLPLQEVSGGSSSAAAAAAAPTRCVAASPLPGLDAGGAAGWSLSGGGWLAQPTSPTASAAAANCTSFDSGYGFVCARGGGLRSVAAMLQVRVLRCVLCVTQRCAHVCACVAYVVCMYIQHRAYCMSDEPLLDHVCPVPWPLCEHPLADKSPPPVFPLTPFLPLTAPARLQLLRPPHHSLGPAGCRLRHLRPRRLRRPAGPARRRHHRHHGRRRRRLRLALPNGGGGVRRRRRRGGVRRRGCGLRGSGRGAAEPELGRRTG